MKVLTFCLMLLVSLLAHADIPAPDDLLDKQYWSTLDEKSKPVFLMGFRLGAGINTFGAPQLPLTLHSDLIAKLIPLIDTFYKVRDNERVYLRSAIEICLMQLENKPKEQIEELTKNTSVRL